jgi:hypothetical protein
MAKLKRFSFSSKSNSSQDLAAAPAPPPPPPSSSSSASSSSWLGGVPPLIFDDHISSGASAAAAAAAAADSHASGGDGVEGAAEWSARDDGGGLDSVPDQLDDLRLEGAGVSGGLQEQATGGVEDGDTLGKVVVRGCIGDVCVRLVDDSDGAGGGCSVEVSARNRRVSGCLMRDVSLGSASFRCPLRRFLFALPSTTSSNSLPLQTSSRRTCHSQWQYCNGTPDTPLFPPRLVRRVLTRTHALDTTLPRLIYDPAPPQALHPSPSILQPPPPPSPYCNLAPATQYPTPPYPCGSGRLSGMRAYAYPRAQLV